MFESIRLDIACPTMWLVCAHQDTAVSAETLHCAAPLAKKEKSEEDWKYRKHGLLDGGAFL